MKSLFFLVLLLLTASCAGKQSACLPNLNPLEFHDEGEERQLRQRCAQNFVAGHWQLVHSITFQLTGGSGATVIGVSVLEGGILKCALLSVEGVVLFEAVLDRDLAVNRALPPFDHPEFARGLMRDVQNIFLPPSAHPPQTGIVVSGEAVCRYVAEEGQTVDLFLSEDGSSRMHIYGPDQRRTRTIVRQGSGSAAAGMIPETLKLIAPGRKGYTLTMKLISAEPI